LKIAADEPAAIKALAEIVTSNAYGTLAPNLESLCLPIVDSYQATI